MRRVSIALVVGVLVGALVPLLEGAVLAGLGVLGWLALHRARSRPGLVARTARIQERRKAAAVEPAQGDRAGRAPARVRARSALAAGALATGAVLAIRAFLVVDRYLLLVVLVLAAVAVGEVLHRALGKAR